MNLSDYYDDLGATYTLLSILGAGGVAAMWKKSLPRLRQRRARERALDDLLFGRPAVPANPLTGEPERIELKPLGERVAIIEHEVCFNNGSSIKDAVTRTEKAVGEIKDRLADGDERFDSIEYTLRDVVGHAAEASTQALSTIETAIKAQPPADA